MAKTKAQKKEVLDRTKKEFETSDALLFADFSKMKVVDMQAIRRTLKGIDSRLEVVKKRLLGLALKDQGIEFDGKKVGGQVGTIFVRGAVENIIQPVYK